jgi:hypothetical protein
MKERWDWLNAFWREKKRGLYKKDFTDFCIDFCLVDRTARESYWDRAEIKGIIRVVYEKKQKFWEYCGSTASQEEETEEQKEPDVMDLQGVELRAEMEEKYCKPCTMPLSTDCRNCSGFFNLKFKENEGE